MLTGLGTASDLPFASTLCGACHEVCPIKINIPKMLLTLRNELIEGKTYPEEKSNHIFESFLFKGWNLTMNTPDLLNIVRKIGVKLQRPWIRKGKIKRIPLLFSGWTKYRDFPVLSNKSFREIWEEKLKDKRNMD